MSGKAIYRSCLTLLVFSVFTGKAQLLTGTVVSDGKPLKGVAISAQSTQNVFDPITTAKNGTFEIEVNGIGDVLTFDKKGFNLNRIELTSLSPLRVELQKPPKLTRAQRRLLRKKHDHDKYLHGGCCFRKGSMVTMADGSQKKIEDVHTGDRVVSAKAETPHLIFSSVVTQVDSIPHKALIELYLEDGRLVQSTADHPYLIRNKGWCSMQPEESSTRYEIPVRQLENGDHCLVLDNGELKPLRITSIRKLNGEEMTWNLPGLSKGDGFFVNGIFVSKERPLPLSP